MQTITIFGATSSIATAIYKIYAQKNCRILLIGRDPTKLEILKSDQQCRNVPAQILTMVNELTGSIDFYQLVEDAWKLADGIDIAILAYGTLPDQKACENDFELLNDNFDVNFTSPAKLLNALASKFESQGSGSIAVITSVAGDRGRKSNYAYGSAKAGLTTYVDGLRARLFNKSVNVLNIKPGFVSTPMTAHLSQGPLFAKPEKVAGDIARAIESRKNTLYTPFFWHFIMLIVKSIPEIIFKRLNM